MTGPWSAYSDLFLIAVGVGSIVLLGLPLLAAPLGWARVVGWPLPDERRLAVYFGRCLGAVVSVLSVFAIVAAGDASLQPFFFQIAMANFALMIGVHAWGALRRVQPWTETAEIVVWAALLGLALMTYPASP